MQRLTRVFNNIVYFTKGKYPPTTLCAEMETREVRECMQKLSEYEDTGLTPEEITSVIKGGVPSWIPKYLEYRQAEEQGLLLKLPCKVGDTVWIIHKDKISKGMCHTIEFTINLNDGLPIYFITTVQLGKILHLILNKTVFLTKEEAEQALEGLEG